MSKLRYQFRQDRRQAQVHLTANGERCLLKRLRAQIGNGIRRLDIPRSRQAVTRRFLRWIVGLAAAAIQFLICHGVLDRIQ